MSRVTPSVDHERLRHLAEALDISDHQAAQWRRFIAALEAAVRVLPGGRAVSGGPSDATLPSLQRTIDAQFRYSLVRVEACRVLSARVTDLYGVLSDKQRLFADRLLVPVLVAVMENEQSSLIPLAA